MGKASFTLMLLIDAPISDFDTLVLEFDTEPGSKKCTEKQVEHAIFNVTAMRTIGNSETFRLLRIIESPRPPFSNYFFKP